MELSYLQYFQTVARLEHISKAAEVLHITQPALSRAISRIEQEVGAQLFIREANRIHLSHAGRVLLFRVEQMLSQYDDAMREISDCTQEDSGPVMALSLSEELFSDFGCQYMLTHPNIQLFHRIMENEEIVRTLERHGADFAITTEPNTGANVIWQPLMKEEYVLVVSRDSKFAGADAIDLTDLAEEPFIFNQGGSIFDTYLRQCCLNAGFDPKIRFKGVDSDLPWELLRRNQGVMFLPASTLHRKYYSNFHAQREHVTTVKIGYPGLRRIIGIAWLRGGYINKSATAAMQGVRDYYQGFQGKPGIELM